MEEQKQKEIMNGMLYQRKIQKKTMDNIKKAKIKAILARKKMQAERVLKEQEEELEKKDPKSLKFYEQVFTETKEQKKQRLENSKSKRKPKGTAENKNKKISTNQKNEKNVKKNKDFKYKRSEQKDKKFEDMEPHEQAKHTRTLERKEAEVRRNSKFKKFRKTTRKGQPVMKHRINDLLEKIRQTA